jgi:hypothetical protein
MTLSRWYGHVACTGGNKYTQNFVRKLLNGRQLGVIDPNHVEAGILASFRNIMVVNKINVRIWIKSSKCLCTLYHITPLTNIPVF